MSSFTRLSLTLTEGLLAVLLLSTPSFAAADAACQPLFDAMTKYMSVSAHSYQTETSPGGKSDTGEAIHTNGNVYVLHRGKWLRSPITTHDMLKQEQENIRDAKTTCRYCAR